LVLALGERALAVDPAPTAVQCERAATTGTDLQATIAACNRAITLHESGQLPLTDAELRDSLVNRGAAYRGAGQAQNAVRDLTRAIQMDGRFALAYAWRGTALADLGNLDGALRDFDQAVTLNPTLWGAYIERGARLRLVGRHSE